MNSRFKGSISPTDAATIIRTLGALLVEVHGAVAGEAQGGQQASGWGSKQRELLLRALIDRVALHARTFENAALSATDDALATFARDEFKKGVTKSHRDRAPIAKNIDKVVGGWLRLFRRTMKQDAIIVTMPGTVALAERKARFRLILSFEYPRRIVRDRRLLVTARFEELDSGGSGQLVPFRADAKAFDVALPEKRRLKAGDEHYLQHLLQSLRAFAEVPDDAELREALRSYADDGFRTFAPWSAPKILVAVFTSVLGCTLLAGAAEWLYHRMNMPSITPLVSTRCTPTPAVMLRFTALPRGGVHVERAGVPLPMRDGVAIDEHASVGRNTYSVRATESYLAPWEHDVTVEMPACPEPACADPPCNLTSTMKLTPARGVFDLTRDKTGLGDAPAVIQKLNVQANHGDEHLDAYIAQDCDECRRNVRFLSYLGAIEELDVKLTIDFGDSSDAIILLSDEATAYSENGFDMLRPHIFKSVPEDSDSNFYSLFAPHEYADEGSYVVTIVATGRRAANERYEYVKTLRRRIRVGAVPSIEMFESFHVPTTSTSN
jgi:hypothetical protein